MVVRSDGKQPVMNLRLRRQACQFNFIQGLPAGTLPVSMGGGKYFISAHYTGRGAQIGLPFRNYNAYMFHMPKVVIKIVQINPL